jgi:hypothetical protein
MLRSKDKLQALSVFLLEPDNGRERFVYKITGF